MVPKVVSLLALALVLGVACHGSPVSEENYGTIDPLIGSIVKSLLSDVEYKPRISAELTEKFENLTQCYNGTFTKLKSYNQNSVVMDIKQEELEQFCQQNRDILLDSYWYNIGKNVGAALIMPVEPIRYFDEYVEKNELQGLSLKDQLIDFRNKWNFSVERRRHTIFCRDMINLVDTEFGQWAIKADDVVKYFETKIKQPIVRALELCRIVKDLKF